MPVPEAAAFAVPHRCLGEDVGAAVVLKPNARVRIETNRFLQVRRRGAEVSLIEPGPSPQKVMVGVQIRRTRDGLLGFTSVERYSQSAGHRRRNFILNREHIVLRAVESFRPQLKTMRHVNQLYRDPEPAAGGAHAAGEQA